MTIIIITINYSELFTKSCTFTEKYSWERRLKPHIASIYYVPVNTGLTTLMVQKSLRRFCEWKPALRMVDYYHMLMIGNQGTMNL